MLIVAKRGGESLNPGHDARTPWTEQGRRETTAVLRDLSTYVKEQSAAGRPTGALIVMGGGNLAMRGVRLQTMGVEPLMGDEIGMTATFWNAQVVVHDLERANVDTRLLIPPGIEYRLPGVPELEVATPKSLRQLVENSEVGGVGFGSGTPGQTTDAAALDYAVSYRRETGDRALALKGTKHNGVFDDDPAQNPDARPLAVVSAGRMVQEGWFAVDPVCLDLIQEHGIEMRVHSSTAPLVEAVAGRVGTLIVPQPGVLQYA